MIFKQKIEIKNMININTNTIIVLTHIMEKRSLHQIIKTEDQKTEIIRNNVVLMLSRRIFIDNHGEKNDLLKLDNLKYPEVGADKVFTIKCLNSEEFAAKIIFGKVTTSGKQSALSEFIKDYGKYRKIIIASEYSNKIRDYCNKSGIQIFLERDMLEDVIKGRDQPKFELLTPAEMKRVEEEYNITSYTGNRTGRDDMIARYFDLKHRDICRVYRPSPVSGYTIAYRYVD